MGTIVRAILVIVGLVQLVGGFAIIVGGSADAPGGLWLMAIGGFLLVIPFLERARYRSEATEHGTAAVGPGGGETMETPLEPRFRPTPEAFVDPTSGHRMRVLVDPRTGERRYVAEGDR
jgi:hypothetical protein